VKELCIDARMLLSSGIGTYLKNLIKQFIDGPFKLRLIGDPAVFETLGWRSGFDLIPCKSSIYSLTEQLKLPLVIPKCDIFWSPHYNVPLLPIKAKVRVVTIHDVFHLATFSSLKIQEKIYAKYVLQKAVNSSSHIFTGSSFSAEEICKYTNADRKKISVIYHGVDPELFSAIRDESALQKLKTPQKSHMSSWCF
jgi:glycosyltransferase involved in cell wall biosynthesis